MLSSLNQWYWFGAAAILLVVEMLGGAGFLFWFGVAAAITGVIAWIVPSMSSAMQTLIFAVLGIIVAAGWWSYLRRNPIKSDEPNLNRRNEEYIGRIFTLESPVENGYGHIRVDDSMWRVACEHELPVGAKVRIVAADGTILKGEKAE